MALHNGYACYLDYCLYYRRMTAHSEQSPGQAVPIAEVLTYPLETNVSNDFKENYAFTKRGVGIEVVLQGNDDPVFTKKVWQRGTWLPVRPFYERRLALALDKASRVAGALCIKNSIAESIDQQQI